MRKNHLQYLIVFILAGLTSAWFVSTGAAQTPEGARSAIVISSPQNASAGNATFALRGTTLLTRPVTDDLREEQRQQIIRYFQSQIAATPAKRDALWQPNFSSVDAYKASVRQHRAHLREMLGLAEHPHCTMDLRPLNNDANLLIANVSLPAESGFSARALYFSPLAAKLAGAVIAIPPASQSPEEFAGVSEGSKPAPWLKALLARNIAVAIPITIARSDDHPICQQAGGRDRRRVLWRAGFIVGRTLVALEVEQVLLLRDFLGRRPELTGMRVVVMGQGEGGMTALYAGALDESLTAVASIDYFQQRENGWQDPVDQVINGQLNEFGDAEVAALIAPRPLFVGLSPEGTIPQASASAEFARAQRFYKGLKAEEQLAALDSQDNLLETSALKLAVILGATESQSAPEINLQVPPSKINEALNQHFESWFAYLQQLIAASAQNRKKYWQLDSTPAAERPEKAQKLRTELAQLVGVIHPDVPMNPRTRLIAESDKFLAYEVFLDVVPGVEVYGHLLIPRVAGGTMHERLPAVVCQHGFDGSPKYISGVGTDLESNDHFYHCFGQRLAERGYVVFAPYLSVPEVHTGSVMINRADLINPLVRQAAAIGMLRTSIELAKLHRVVDFLQSLPFVDPDHLGYYGLSYGGYSATWMPPLEPRLKLTVISAFFNDWQTMLTDPTRQGASYWSLPDEDFYNWNVLNRFVHTQMIAAMWPRPVCIEYGSEDQVTTPGWHQRAWQEVSAFAGAWGMQGKIVDEKFLGPHSIHGIGTFFFLDRWLRPERAAGRDYGCRDDNYCYQNLARGFHGYDPRSTPDVPFVTQPLDSSPTALIRGSFYVNAGSPVFTGMAFKLARTGNPGNLVVHFGTKEGAADVGEAEVLSSDIHPQYDLWYEASLKKPVRLDPGKLYYFELQAASGSAPDDAYIVFGPQPLGAKDYPAAFGLSFRALTQK